MFKNVLIALSALAFAGGVAAILLSLPERAWNGAMLRLGARLQLQSPASVSGARKGNGASFRAVVAHAPDDGELASSPEPTLDPPPALTALDRAVDVVIEILRRIIGSRGFPRRALRALGVVLILIAVFCFIMGNLVGNGEADNEGLGRPAVAAGAFAARVQLRTRGAGPFR